MKWSAEQIKEFVEAILEEKKQATEMAEREREKAAQALATSMENQMRQGDENLRSHIDQQIGQIREALSAAQRESDIRFQASEKAIEKAEVATEKRFESVNEFRSQLGDQTATFTPREVHDSEIGTLRGQVEEVKALAQSAKDQAVGRSEAKEGISKSTALAMAIVSAGIAGLGIVVTVVLAANGAI